MNKGIIGKVLGWFTHPSFSQGTMLDYGAGLVLILIAAFLWSTVVKQIQD